MNGVPLSVWEWMLGSSREKIEPNKVPLWIGLRNVLVEVWNVEGLSYLASGIGKLIYVG